MPQALKSLCPKSDPSEAEGVPVTDAGIPRSRTIFSSGNNHQAGSRGASVVVVLSEVAHLILPAHLFLPARPVIVPVTDAKSGHGGRFSQLIWRPSLGQSRPPRPLGGRRRRR